MIAAIPNINFLSPNGFLLSIDRCPKSAFFTQSVELPGINLQSIEQHTPLSPIAIPTDLLTFDPLTLQFTVDENMSNWLEIFRWMQGLGFPETRQQYTTENLARAVARNIPLDLPANYSDAKLMILSSHNNIVKTIHFVDCFPTRLTGIRFASTATDVVYATADLTLNYSYFKIEE